jgi:hypothetical protein
VNCDQVRAMLAIYRELKNDQVDMTELEVHLIDCAACRQAFNRYNFVGERLRSLPPIEPPPDSHSRLMQSLAAEHSRFLQHTPTSAASQPIPTFLLPYLQSQAQGARQTDVLTAFSTAETGPLPVIHSQTRRRRFAQTNHFAILGLAAAFLMVMMMSGLTSLLLLASHGSTPTSATTSSITKPSQVAMATYSAATGYPHVASAVADRNYIYYTAYGDSSIGEDNSTVWMLSEIDRKTQLSIPLLSTVSTNPLIVLGSSQNWLLWLEFDAPGQTGSKVSPGKIHEEGHNIIRKWSLYALPIGQDQTTTQGNVQPLTLLKDTFDESAVPDWVHTPIQGFWFTKDGLLVAAIDAKGKAHLLQYQLTPGKDPVSSEIARASDGHIITSPTANSDGTSIFWSEEWFTADGAPHGNIWTQQISDSLPGPGRWLPHKEVTKSLFRSDEMSFHPQVVDNTLFLLSINAAGTSTSSASATATTELATPGASATAGPTATPAAVSDLSNTPVIARSDPQLYTPQPDESIRGTLQAYSLTNYMPLQLPFDTNGQASAPQGGSRFLFWQDSDKGFQMYDVVAGQPVTVGSATVPKNADFLAVNGDTAVWMLSASLDNNTTPSQASASNLSVTFMAFNWPDKAQA